MKAQKSQHLVFIYTSMFPRNLVFYNTYTLCKYVLLWSNVKSTYIYISYVILLGTV